MLVHIQSTLQETFGRVDENGDVVEQFPFQLAISTLNKESFDEVLKKLLEVRQKLREKLSVEGNGQETGDRKQELAKTKTKNRLETFKE
jgi:hypothetical protein